MSVIDRSDTKDLGTSRTDLDRWTSSASSDGVERPRVAIAHDYLTQRGGAEKVVLSMARAFPDAVIYTTLFDPENTYPEFSDMDIRVSPLNKVGFLRRSHRAALPMLPAAASSIHIDADLVLVSSSGWAHGFRTSGKKLVYCYSPARWLYQAEAYLGESAGWKKRLALSVLTPFLRRWDRRAAASCDEYLAISNAVQGRITAAYDRPSMVLPAPAAITVEPEPEIVSEVAEWLPTVDHLDNDGVELAGDFYLCISRLLAYKNVDKVIEAFRGTSRRLVVVGRGPEAERLRASKPDNVAMVSDLSDRQMAWLYSHSTAVVAASYEDYGLTPIEGAAYGKPAALLRWGGFLDTAVEHVTAEYFDDPEPEAIRAAVTRVEKRLWDSEKIADHVTRFSDDYFAAQLHEIVDRLAPDPKDMW